MALGRKDLGTARVAKKAGVLVLLLVALIPFLWYRSPYIIAKGDYFPYILNTKCFGNDFYLWSSNNVGNPSPMPAYALNGLLLISLRFLVPSVGFWQILQMTIYFIVATFSMAYFAQQIYPKEKLTAIIASIFYVFNFFTMMILLNIGMMWTYAFLPLLLALFIKAITHTRNRYRYAIFFALAFTAGVSTSSINLADVALIIIGLASVLFYYAVLERKIPITSLFKNLAFILIVTFLLTLWWTIPILNYYLLSASTELQADVSVVVWSWTHVRGSFLNLFWLNAGWGWRPEYFAYYSIYSSSPVLTFLVFTPFLFASASLLFKSEKNRFNSYIMLLILFFIFLAKGLHEPASFVNLSLYEYIPYMTMFREPFSKFTLIMIPFLALMIGYSTNRIVRALAHSNFKWHHALTSIFILGVVFIFTTSTFPLLTDPIESKTEQIPYSSYVRIPEYWFEASEWLNNKAGDFRVLVTPLDDYYQVPYTWGYYGTDAFVERLIAKPVISPSSAYAYKVNPNIMALMNQLRDSIKYNRTLEFEIELSLLNVKYILQRNDLDSAYMALTNRDVLNSEKMKAFLSSQSNVVLIQTIGKLDVYEYVAPAPYLNVLEPKKIQDYRLGIANKTLLSLKWDFTLESQFQEWKNATFTNQFDAICKLFLEDGKLRYELWNSTWGWKTITSPLMPAQYDAKYDIQFDVKGQNAYGVHTKMFEYNAKMQIIHGEYAAYAADGTFDWKEIQFNYTPKNQDLAYLQMQIWNGHETDKPFPNIIWLDNVTILGYRTELNATKVQEILESRNASSPARIISFERINPTKITAKIEAAQPFILTVNEAFDPNWRAHIDGETYDSVPIFSVMNGFQINKTGKLDIAIEYEPQRWFYFGSAVSTITFIACTAYLTFTHAKTKAIAQKIKHKLIKPKEAREKANPPEPNQTN